MSTTPTERLWAERQGTRRWVGRNARGAQVEIGSGDAPGVFSPGELLKIALAGCVGLSADAPLERRIGPDGPATVDVNGTAVPDQERYGALTERLVVDLTGLDEAARVRLFTSLHRAIDRYCTVARTLQAGATTTFTIAGEPSGPA